MELNNKTRLTFELGLNSQKMVGWNICHLDYFKVVVMDDRAKAVFNHTVI